MWRLLAITNHNIGLLSVCYQYIITDNTDSVVEIVLAMAMNVYSSSISETPNLFQERRSLSYYIHQCNRKDELQEVTRITVEAMNRKNDKLFVGHVWEGCLVLADFIVQNSSKFENKSILELGAGCALPSMVVSRFNPKRVVCTDYPDPDLIDHIRTLIQQNQCTNIEIDSYEWGEESLKLLSSLNNSDLFDVIFCAELLWKDTLPLMEKLLQSIRSCLKPIIGRAYFCFAERLCEGFSKESTERVFDVAQKEYGFQSTLLYTTDKYPDAIENTPSIVYLYEFVLL